MRRQSPRPYISDQGGWPLFWILTGLALALGLLVRNLSTPTHLADRLRSVLREADPRVCASFGEVRLSLADGIWPSFAFEVRDFRTVVREPSLSISQSAQTCGDGPALLSAESIRLPLRWARALQSQWSASEVVLVGMQLDLDQLNALLARTAQAKPVSHATASPAHEAPHPSKDTNANGMMLSKPWWLPGDLARLDNIVQALVVRSGIVHYEGRQKRVSIIDLKADVGAQDEQVRLRGQVALDPSVTYGEVLPAVDLEGVIEASQARLTARAQMAEGTLKMNGLLQPGPSEGQEVVDLQVAVDNIPVSMLSGLITKSGIVEGRFRAKALWLSCRAAIRGPLQGLLDRAPLEISACHVEGQGGRVQTAQMTRDPSGHFKPFQAEVDGLSLRKWFDIFEVRGPDDLVTDYGILSGQVDWVGDGRWKGRLTIKDTQLRLMQQSAKGLQRFEFMELEFEQASGQLQSRIRSLKPKDGEFRGEIDYSGESALRTGKLTLRIEALELDPVIEEMLWGGRTNGMAGNIDLVYDVDLLHEGPVVSQLKADITVASVSSSEHEAERLTVRGKADRQRVSFQLGADRVVVRDRSVWSGWLRDALLRPAAELSRFEVEIDGRRDGSQMKWSRGAWLVEGGTRMGLQGEMVGDEVKATMQVDYPKLRGARWRLSGPWREPKVSPDEASFRGLRPALLRDLAEPAKLRSALGLKDD